MIKEITYWYSKILKSPFLKNIVTLSSGMGLASLLTLIFIPFLTRLFSAEEFGQWAIFMMLMQTISLFTFKYEMSILLPKDHKSSLHLSIFSIFILFFSSLVCFGILFFSKDFLTASLFKGFSYDLLLLTPLGGFLLGTYNVLLSWSTRMENYSKIAKSQVLHSSISSPSSAILYFFDYTSALALALGQLIGRIASLDYLFLFFLYHI